MALQMRAVRLADRLITEAGLADVATAPDWRGQGTARALLQAAINVAKSTAAEFLLLFSAARLYASAGLRTVHNPMIWVEMRGAVTQEVHREPAESLMVLQVRDVVRGETAPLDLFGNSF